MKLDDIALIRTGVVTSRKKANTLDEDSKKYKLLTLRCASVSGYLDLQYTEEFITKEELKQEYLTQKGDIIIRLSVPYTAILISKDEWCGYLVPSHFAIIRCNQERILPEYVLWFLRRDTIKQKILQNASGSGAFGTINSGFFNSLEIRNMPLSKQHVIGQLQILADEEQQLLRRLSSQKAILNKAQINMVYDSIKRGN